MTEYEFRVFAMRRSGHHAIINWLLPHFKNETLFFRNPFNPVGGEPKLLYPGEEEKLSHDLECVVYNILDRIHDSCRHPKLQQGKKFFNLLVIRDPFNAFASRCKYCTVRQFRMVSGPRFPVMPCGNKRPQNMGCTTLDNRSLTDVWLSFAREAVGDTNILQDKIVVNFNKWFSDREYRVNLANTIGVEFTDVNINEVREFGDGSSFDNLKFNGKGQMMNVLDRWRTFRGHKWFRDFFTDEVYELCSRLGYDDIVHATRTP